MMLLSLSSIGGILFVLLPLLVHVVQSERIYDDLVFTATKCQELGMSEYFDSCAVLEVCTSTTTNDDNKKKKKRKTIRHLQDNEDESSDDADDYYDPEEIYYDPDEDYDISTAQADSMFAEEVVEAVQEEEEEFPVASPVASPIADDDDFVNRKKKIRRRRHLQDNEDESSDDANDYYDPEEIYYDPDEDYDISIAQADSIFAEEVVEAVQEEEEETPVASPIADDDDFVNRKKKKIRRRRRRTMVNNGYDDEEEDYYNGEIAEKLEYYDTMEEGNYDSYDPNGEEGGGGGEQGQFSTTISTTQAESEFATEVVEAEFETIIATEEEKQENRKPILPEENDDEEEDDESYTITIKKEDKRKPIIPEQSEEMMTTTTTTTTTTTAEQQQQEEEEEESSPSSSAAAAASFGYRLEGSSECSWPGPIMRLNHGEKQGLFLKGTDGVVSNLHFHGLHIGSSTTTSDWMYRSVEGTDNMLVYEMDLKNTPHMGGTHWYHSHVQSSSWAQVQGGAFGMIVVHDDDDVGTQDVNVLRLLNDKEHEKILVLDDSQGQQQQQKGVDYYANGLPFETFTFTKDVWYRLRILMVGIDSHQSEMTLEFSDYAACQVHTLAYDGIYRFEVPKPEPQYQYKLTTASRLDVAIKCQATNSIQVDGNSLVEIHVVDDDSSTSTSATPFEDGTNTWSSKRYEYTKDLRKEEEGNKVDTFQIKVDETNINGINEARHKPICNDQKNDFTYGTIQEWTIKGIATHPFHLHGYPMQVTSSQCAPHHEVGEYYDTIIAPDSDWKHPCQVRLNLIDLMGPTTLHCHLFEHAEHGALAYMNVVMDDKEPTTAMTTTATTASSSPPTCIGTCNEPVQPPLLCSEVNKKLRSKNLR